MTSTSLVVLIVDDSAADAEMVQRHLVQSGLTVDATRVETASALEAELKKRRPDAVITDVQLPAISAMDVIGLVSKFDVDLPVMVVSGTGGEDTATDVMRAGAKDFVLKANLTRFSMALQREITDARIRVERRALGQQMTAQAEVLRQMQMLSRAGGFHYVPKTRALVLTEGALRIFEAPEGTPITSEIAQQWLRPEALTQLRTVLHDSSEALDFELPARTHTGRDLWLRVIAKIERDASGSATHLLGALQDVTERRSIEAQLLLQDRLVAMGTIAAGVAHEINNPLTQLIAALPMVREGLRPGLSAPELEDLSSIVDLCHEGARRIATVVRDLKVFARPEESSDPRCDLEAVLDSVLSLLNLEYRHAARIEKLVPPGLLVAAPSARIAQVLTNLIINAAQAMPPRAVTENRIEVRASAERDRVRIVVRDNGVGMAPEVRASVFAPFFTTKPAGLGAGLGLSVTRQIVTSLGGTISVESELGKGTTFITELPCIPAVVAVPSASKSAPRSEAQTRVLVIDDEPMLRRLTVRVLKPSTVIECGSADEGLALLEKDRAFDAILCDLMMPGRSGPQFYAELQRRDGALAERCIFVSGGAVTPEAEQFLKEISDERVVFKPYTADQLKAAIVRVQRMNLSP